MFDGPNSPFYESLIESGFAPAFSPGNGYDYSTREASFSIGVSHVPNETTFKEFEQIVSETLASILEKGFE